MSMYQGEDRVQQVNWMNRVAAEIVNIDMSDGQTTAEELVSFWEQNAENPEWFDSSDRCYLVKQVEENLVAGISSNI